MNKEEIRIPGGTAMLMLGTAFFYDTLQALFNLIPFLGWMLASLLVLFSFLTFNVVWFRIRGIYFMESALGKYLIFRLIKGFIPFIEIMPGLQMFPGITIFVLIVIIETRFDDMLVAKEIVTREELEHINNFVRSMYRKHGAESPEFRHALAEALGEQIRHRLNQTVENKRARLISSNRITEVIDNASQDSEDS